MMVPAMTVSGHMIRQLRGSNYALGVQMLLWREFLGSIVHNLTSAADMDEQAEVANNKALTRIVLNLEDCQLVHIWCFRFQMAEGVPAHGMPFLVTAAQTPLPRDKCSFLTGWNVSNTSLSLDMCPAPKYLLVSRQAYRSLPAVYCQTSFVFVSCPSWP